MDNKTEVLTPVEKRLPKQKRPSEPVLEEIKAADDSLVKEVKKENMKKQIAPIFGGSKGKDDSDNKPISREFYMCDVVELAEKLIGMVLVREFPDGTTIKAMIVETEAYKAPDDKACHAFDNKKTEKTKWFWQEGGHLYMYSIYGNNNCMNIVSATKDEPEAVLIRALEPITNIARMKELRGGKFADKDLTNGPGKLSKAIDIDKSYNGHDLTEKGKLYLINGRDTSTIAVDKSKRINIDYAEEWIDKLWRFTLRGSRFISKK